jgi:hypothetical protein
MLINHFAECKQLALKTDIIADLTQDQNENSNRYETSFFAHQINQGKMDLQNVKRPKITSAVISEISRLMGVKFPVDNQSLPRPENDIPT